MDGKCHRTPRRPGSFIGSDQERPGRGKVTFVRFRKRDAINLARVYSALMSIREAFMGNQFLQSSLRFIVRSLFLVAVLIMASLLPASAQTFSVPDDVALRIRLVDT